MAQPGIYKIINTVTGEVYIGSSARCVFKRHAGHFRALRRGKHENYKLQRAWKTYGESAFAFSVIEIINDTTDILSIEQRYIDAVTPAKRYNIYPTAGGPLGYKWTPEQLARVSVIRKGKGHTPEVRAKMSSTRTGRKHSEEWCRNIGNGNRGKKRTAQQREHISNVQRGRILSQEHRGKIGSAQKGKYVSDLTKENMCRAWVLRKLKKQETSPNLNPMEVYFLWMTSDPSEICAP